MGQLDRFKLDGQIALVRGGGGAIGGAMAVALAEAGAKLAVTDISQDLVDATAVTHDGSIKHAPTRTLVEGEAQS